MEILNFLFVAGIIVSFIAYFYYKTKQFRTILPIRKKWNKAKAGVALGIFMTFVGLNITIIYSTTIGFIVAALFIVVGMGYAINNFKRVQHEGRYVAEELSLNQ